jgi:hypothetical protein
VNSDRTCAFVESSGGSLRPQGEGQPSSLSPRSPPRAAVSASTIHTLAHAPFLLAKAAGLSTANRSLKSTVSISRNDSNETAFIRTNNSGNVDGPLASVVPAGKPRHSTPTKQDRVLPFARQGDSDGEDLYFNSPVNGGKMQQNKGGFDDASDGASASDGEQAYDEEDEDAASPVKRSTARADKVITK